MKARVRSRAHSKRHWSHLLRATSIGWAIPSKSCNLLMLCLLTTACGLYHCGCDNKALGRGTLHLPQALVVYTGSVIYVLLADKCRRACGAHGAHQR